MDCRGAEKNGGRKMVNKEEVVARTATEALKMLWREEFFFAWKQKAPIVEALSKKGNHFPDTELCMALMRANHLTRRGKRGRYEYIQKYPFLHEGAGAGEKKTGGKR